MKQQGEEKLNTSLEDEQSLRQKNLELYDEIQTLKQQGEDAPGLREKVAELKKHRAAYMQKYGILCELESRETVGKPQSRHVPAVLKILLSAVAVIGLVILGAVMLAQPDTPGTAEVGTGGGKSGEKTYVVWEDVDSAVESATMGYLIEENDYIPREQTEEDFIVLGEDTRVPDLDSVKDADLLTVRRVYEWMAYSGKTTLKYTPSFYQEIYEAYRAAARYMDSENFHRYIDDAVNSGYVLDIAHQLRAMGSGMGYSEWETALEAINFVQSIPYETDEDSVGEAEWPKYVVETLYDMCGDCEDKSFLLAGILNELGYGAVLLVFETHMAVGLAADPNIEGFSVDYHGNSYYYVETSSPGWGFGQVPTILDGCQCVVVEMK